MYAFLIAAACIVYIAAFIAALMLNGRESPKPGRVRVVAIFSGFALSGALLLIADNTVGQRPRGDVLWETVLYRAPDYLPLLLLVTASITCSHIFFAGSNARRADEHVAVPGRPRLPRDDESSARP